MKLIFAVLCFVIQFSLMGQDLTKTRTLEVIGVSNYKVMPDVGILTIYINYVGLDLNTAIDGLRKKQISTENLLMEIAINKNAIKTNHYHISENTIYKNNDRIDSGFVAVQTLEIEFPNKMEVLQDLLLSLRKNNSSPAINFQFTLSDTLKSKINKELIVKAVADAKEKSILISSTSGVKLSKIISIEYGHFNDDSMRELIKSSGYGVSGNSNPDAEGFSVKEIVFTDNVTITWAVE